MSKIQPISDAISNPMLVTAEVTGEMAGYFEITTAEGKQRARRAASCLLDPRPGDRVMAAWLYDGGWYLLAILERQEQTSPSITLQADTRIHAASGKLTVSADSSLEFKAGQSVEVAAPAMRAESCDIEVSSGSVHVNVILLETVAETTRSIAKAVERTATYIRDKCHSLFRQVEDLEHVKAGQVFYDVEKVLNMHAEHSVLTAKGEVKIDGERVHLG